MPVTRHELDLENLAEISPWFRQVKPDVVVNCAAYTAVDAAEAEPAKAHLINALAVEELARSAGGLRSRFVTFSTDYVFDGSKQTPYIEDDLPGPASVYGSTKLKGERLALAAYSETLIIRTSWVLSGTHDNFASTMLQLLNRDGAKVVDDQIGRPTLASDLAKGTLSCIEKGASGVVHLTNRGEASWFVLAREIAELAGRDPGLITACTTADSPRPAVRPPNSRLDSVRLQSLGIEPLPDYHSSLGSVVDTLVARGN